MGMDGMGDKTPPFIPSVPGAVGMDGNGWEWMGMDGKKEGFFLEYFPDTFNEYEAASRGR